MDGLAADNEGVYVLGATNHPWDVDVALRRPGRFDRMVLVLPPDEPAREAVLRYSLRDRPIAGVDTGVLARMTSGYSGADLAFVCESAAERALLDSVRTGRPRMIQMSDLEAAVREVGEETGLVIDRAELRGPLALRHVVHGYSDVVVEQDEVFFGVTTRPFEVDDAGHTEEERLTMTEHAWWTRAELEATDETIWPANLLELWERIDLDAPPVDLGRQEESTVTVLPD
jgi:ATP-dependent Zn protease